MAEHAARLARIFTPTYARLVNAQIVHPVSSVVVKPTELIGALARPRNVAVYEPHRPAAYLAATLSYGIIMGHPFMDGNKRTAFFLANAYMRAMGLRLPGIADEVELGEAAMHIADQHVFCAAATSGLDKLAASMGVDMDYRIARKQITDALARFGALPHGADALPPLRRGGRESEGLH